MHEHHCFWPCNQQPRLPMARLAMRMSGTPRNVLTGLRRDEGYALFELIAVMLILGVVLGALVGSFTTGLRHEIDQTRRVQAHANVRLALQRMRTDIHCAGGAPQVDQNAYGGFTLTLTENHEGQDGWCPSVMPAGNSSSGVQWCTVPYTGSTTRFVLYRYLGLSSDLCGTGSTSTFQVDYTAQPPSGWPTNAKTTSTPTSWAGNLWPDPAACPSGDLPTVAVDLNAVVDPVNHPHENYELRDQIAIRNANRCP